MAGCSAITASGRRCKGVPVRGSELCAAHHPDTQAKRRSGARRGGKARGRAEIAGIKAEIRELITRLESGALERGVGAVMLQAYNTLARYLELERRVVEAEEIERRIAALEAQQGYAPEAYTWQT